MLRPSHAIACYPERYLAEDEDAVALLLQPFQHDVEQGQLATRVDQVVYLRR